MMTVDNSLTLIASSNHNPVYMRFGTLQKEACRHLELEFHFCKSGAEEFRITKGESLIPPIEGISDVFVSQVSRYITPCFFPDSDFLVGDIDMLFLSKKFVDGIKQQARRNKGILFIDSDTYRNILRFPCCYYVAKGSVFADILGIQHPDRKSFEDKVREIWSRNEGWTGDEYFFSEAALLASERIAVRHHNLRVRSIFGPRKKLHGRINRDGWSYSRMGLCLNKYIDVHCLRPIEEHIPQLRHIFNYVYCGLDGRRYLGFELRRILGIEKDAFPEELRLHP